jgi:hypothetical protein
MPCPLFVQLAVTRTTAGEKTGTPTPHRRPLFDYRVTGCRMTTRRKPACLGERPKSALNWGARR